MMKEYFDVIVIIPLEEELIEFLDIFPSTEDRSSETTFCHVVDSGRDDFRIIVCQQESMGKSSAALAANNMLARYDAGVIVCLGIAGSLSEDMKLGDVCYSGNIVDIYDNTKVIDLEDGTSDTEMCPTNYPTPNNITASLSFIRTQPDTRPLYTAWQREREIFANTLIANGVPTRTGTIEKLGGPNTKNGTIACGAVSCSKVYNTKLKKINRAILAIETESGGIFAQAAAQSTPALTIRGISDYADKEKNSLEKVSKNQIRKLAASNAASFLQLQISNPRFTAVIQNRRNGFQAELDILPTKPKKDLLAESVIILSETIDNSLRKLSPEYKLQPKGYRLPLPRLRKPSRNENTEDSIPSTPIEIRSAISKHDKILISLPRTYPDQSLAWVIADDLLTSEISSKQVLPVVIDGDAIKGRKFDFNAVSIVDLEPLKNLEGIQLVLIVENPPLFSKHRLETIFTEMGKYSDAKFIFITRGDANLITESDFESRAAALLFEVCPISFLEIAHFIQKNFEMSGSEAEVVALRLRDTFTRFDLDAHPTYFAGIPKETLSALLQANRRSELLQLAVDGFLTFLVAGDRADVALSRSTRARFLRKLVVEMNINKRSFDQAQLIAYTKEFAEQHDFDINPMVFIQGFVDQGIMHFESERIKISLPFIESYLLASELSAAPDKASIYFDLDDQHFDLSSFDLYAEIGASPEMVATIIQNLTNSLSKLALKDSTQHILLTETISPVSIRKLERTDALRNRLRRAAEAVHKGTDKSNEKQQILDLNDKVREASGRQRKIKNNTANDELSEESLIPLSDSSRYWAISTILLGSGA